MSNEGKVDGELFRNKIIQKKYLNLVIIPVPIAKPEIVVFTKNLEFQVRGWESLSPYTIGVQIGSKLFEENTKGMRVSPTRNLKQAFGMLNKGSVDIVVQTRMNGLDVIKKLNLRGIKVLEPPLVYDAVYHFLHKKHQSLVPSITNVLENMEKNGRLTAIRGEVIQNLIK